MDSINKYGNSCLGCRICEAVCSTHWGNKIQPSLSAIKIINTNVYCEPKIIRCKNCTEPSCVDACPQGCLTIVNGIVKFNGENCIGCKACVAACPFDACSFDDTSDRVIICDGCDGEYLCEKFCPTNVLQELRKQNR